RTVRSERSSAPARIKGWSSAEVRRDQVQGSQCHRARLCPFEAVARTGHSLRQTRRRLSSRCRAQRCHCLVTAFIRHALVQSERLEVYARAVEVLDEAGLVYECYCSRKDIAQAPSAPHAPPGAYPGTCRNLGAGERDEQRRRLAANGRQPALRLRTDNREHHVDDVLLGRVGAVVDDFVLRRGDGVFAYNLTVVVDDGASGVDEVVRGDDLASSAPRQAYLARLLGIREPEW